jgi:DNA processing protein
MKTNSLSHKEEQLKFQLALTQIPKVGHQIAKKLIQRYTEVDQIFREKKSHLEKIEGIGRQIAQNISSFKNFKPIEKEIDYIQKNDVRVLFYNDVAYPSRLKEAYDAPVVLFSKGQINYNQSKALAIVGTRNPTKYGREKTEEIIAALRKLNVLVISGMAYGIDIAAHKAAIENDLNTIGVLAHGFETLYPGSHQGFVKRMLHEKQGNILTEYFSYIKPEKEHFPARNRIVAGLSDAVLVVESKTIGGSLITAELANAYARDVFAIPGKASDETSQGCNKLIKTNKAALVECSEDILYLMNWQESANPKKVKAKQTELELDLSLNPKENQVIKLISDNKTCHLDQISTLASISHAELAMLLFELEIKNKIKALPGKNYSLY